MKLSLVVAQGVHQGKVIPIAGQQFLIGRDPQCQLRPASPAVSKQHCAITVREGRVFVRDFGSTNGTAINEVPIDGEREMLDNDKLKVGPLEFILRIERDAIVPTPTPLPRPTPTPVPTPSKAPAVAVAAVAIRPTPTPVPTPSKAPAVAVAAVAIRPTPVPKPAVAAEMDADQLAAMLLAEDADETPTGSPLSVPDGTTVMEIPAIPGDISKPPATKPANDANTSAAARDILSKYMRRPRGTT